MGFKLKFNSLEQIELRRKLGKDGEAQKFFTSEVARISDDYVPMDAGPLKNTKKIGPHTITYVQPYSKYQWYGVSKNGNPLHYGNGGLRGKEWCNRAVIDHKDELFQSVANFCGGKAK